MPGTASLAALGAEAAALGNARAIIDLVGFILKKAQEAKSFRSECLDLTNQCIGISLAFLEHEKELQNVHTRSKFQACLRDVYLAVTECGEWNILHVGWEILVSHKMQDLKDKLVDIQRSFGTELLMRITGSTAQATRELKDMQVNMVELKRTAEQTNEQRAEFLGRIRELEAELSRFHWDSRSLRPLQQMPLDMVTVPHPNLNIQSQVTVAGAEEPRSGLYQDQKITFEKIIHRNFERLPHIVQIYQQMGSIALVQQFYAVADVNGVKYALMEDVSSYPCIETAATSGILSSYTELQLLRFAYELVTTVSTLHDAGVLIKSLSTNSVVIVDEGGGKVRPKLTGLSQARMIWQVSTLADQDVRFDAPETELTGCRTKMSDMWSLIVTLLSLFTCHAPFEIRSEELNEESIQKIQGKLRSGGKPFSSADDEQSKVVMILMDHLQRDPTLRPTASSLAQQLFEFVLQLAADTPWETSPQGPPTTPARELHALAAEILAKIKQAKIPGSSKTSSLKTPVERIDRTKFAALVQAAQKPDPSLLFVVGLAHIWDLAPLGSIGESALEGKPREVIGAKLAIPYLETAEKLGHLEAAKELFRSHRTLAEYYKEVVTAGVID